MKPIKITNSFISSEIEKNDNLLLNQYIIREFYLSEQNNLIFSENFTNQIFKEINSYLKSNDASTFKYILNSFINSETDDLKKMIISNSSLPDYYFSINYNNSDIYFLNKNSINPKFYILAKVFIDTNIYLFEDGNLELFLYSDFEKNENKLKPITCEYDIIILKDIMEENIKSFSENFYEAVIIFLDKFLNSNGVGIVELGLNSITNLENQEIIMNLIEKYKKNGLFIYITDKFLSNFLIAKKI